MKTELKAKFLQHLTQKKKDDEGFTLIELLVVIIIIGILSAIALPSFLNQAAKAKQSEAKQFVGAVNRAQQAFRIENSSFATDVAKLGIGLPTSTTNYIYGVTGAVDTAIVGAVAKDATSLKSYSGGVVVLASGETAALSCQTTGVGATPPTLSLTASAATAPDCPSGSEQMK